MLTLFKNALFDPLIWMSSPYTTQPKTVFQNWENNIIPI